MPRGAPAGGRQRAGPGARDALGVGALCVELEQSGLDRPETMTGPSPRAPARDRVARAELASRAARDDTVRRRVRSRAHRPAQPGAGAGMLLAAGIDVPNAREWTSGLPGGHPVVPALLAWRADGGSRRPTAGAAGHAHRPGRPAPGSGRPATRGDVRASVYQPAGALPLVRRGTGLACLGDRRVLAAVSGDPRSWRRAGGRSLCTGAARLGVERPVAKVAVLAAMYGQRSGAAGEALAGLRRAYPVAVRLLEAAAERGGRGETVRTFGGRAVHTAPPAERGQLVASPVAAARGRFARNAIIQGTAAELFKAWAATIRATTGDLGAEIVLCLHDEVLVHVPTAAAQECAARVEQALTDAARRWLGVDGRADAVRFVADVSVIERWSRPRTECGPAAQPLGPAQCSSSTPRRNTELRELLGGGSSADSVAAGSAAPCPRRTCRTAAPARR